MAPVVAMLANRKKDDSRLRQNLRLEPKVWAAIDAACERRSGYVPRNSWITEAVLEKLERESQSGSGIASGDRNV
jgi:hypothetical protein